MANFDAMSCRQEILANANENTLPDVIGPHLAVIFCGINPGARAAAAGLPHSGDEWSAELKD